MKPYYQDDFATIYHGDCREVLPGLQGDVLVTDPPYGIAFASNQPGKFKGSQIANDADTACRDWVLEFWGDRPALIFGSWKLPNPRGTRALLVWDKELYGGGMGDLSMPWKMSHEFIYVLGKGFSGHRGPGVLRSETVVTWSGRSGQREHPNQKPKGLLAQLLAKCPPGVVIDPFMGSGSTLRAAKDLGRKAVGIEIEERYCEVAARRLAQEALAI